MKRVIRFRSVSTLACTVAVLLWTGTPAQATYKGTLRSDTPFTVQILSSAGNAGDTAVTVYYLGRALDVEAVFSVPAGSEFSQECAKPGERIRRILVEVDPPVGGTGLLKVNQGTTTRYEDPFQVGESGNTLRFVFAVIP